MIFVGLGQSAGLLAAAAGVQAAFPKAPQPTAVRSGLSAVQVMEIAGKAAKGGDPKSAIIAYEALAKDPDIDVRSEARFRHALLLVAAKDFAGAAALFRKILDERPEAARVRLELASVLYQLGERSQALRAMRQAQAGGLPPEVALIVDQFASSLRAMKPWGASFSVALVPDSNINRATKSDTLDTIIAPLDLSEDARAKTGVGLRLGGQAFARLPLYETVSLQPRLSSQAELYREDQFNDVSASAQLGLEVRLPKGRIQPAVGFTSRRYGQAPYARTTSGSLNWTHRIGRRAQLDSDLSVSRANYLRNSLQDGWIYDVSSTLERALSARSGGSVSLAANRQTARDAGYATKARSMGLLYWREIGPATLFLNGNVRVLTADERLLLFPEKRRDKLAAASIGGTLRKWTFRNFAPMVRVGYERSWSTVGLYRYSRISSTFGITRAF